MALSTVPRECQRGLIVQALNRRIDEIGEENIRIDNAQIDEVQALRNRRGLSYNPAVVAAIRCSCRRCVSYAAYMQHYTVASYPETVDEPFVLDYNMVLSASMTCDEGRGALRRLDEMSEPTEEYHFSFSYGVRAGVADDSLVPRFHPGDNWEAYRRRHLESVNEWLCDSEEELARWLDVFHQAS